MDTVSSSTGAAAPSALMLERKYHDATAMLRQVYDDLRGLAEEKSMALSLALPCDVPKIYCDRDLIVQALTNIVWAAVSEHGSQGTVRLSVDVDVQSLQFAVEDRFQRAETREELFDAFSVTRARPEAGQSFAQAITARIVSAHHGELWVQSELGKSRTVRMVLPLSVPTSRFAATPRRSTAHTSETRF